MFRPNSDLSRGQKRRILAVVVTVVLAGVAIGAVTQFHEQRLNADVTVVDANDPSNIHRATHLTVQVTNRESREIQPEFQTVHGQLTTHFYWDRVSGPQTLQPGESARYQIQAPVATAAIPYDTRALLAVNDNSVDDQLRTTFTLEAPEPPAVLNPSLRHWLIRSGSGEYPYRWSTSTAGQPGTASIDSTANRSGATLSVHGVDSGTGSWRMARLSQQSAFPGKLHVEATPRTVVQNTSERPSRAVGVGLRESNHRVWVMFAAVENRTVVHRTGDPSYLYVYVPAEPGERTSVTVDVRSLYETYEWSLPTEEQWVVDGVTYQRRPVRTFGLAGVHPDDRPHNASITIYEISEAERAQANATAT